MNEIETFMDRLKLASPVGTIMRVLIDPLLRGRTKYYDTWDDLRAPATGINPPGAVSDPTPAEDGTLLFSDSAVNLIAILFQMPHTWKEGTTVKPHIHWMKSVDGSGTVVWEMRYRIIAISEVPTAWSEWLPVESHITDPINTQAHAMSGFPDIDMEDRKISTMLSIQLRRDPLNVGDDYAADAALLEFDIHYRKDGNGSFNVGTKGELPRL